MTRLPRRARPTRVTAGAALRCCAGAVLVGVNARNLKTLDVDPATFAKVAPLLPDDTVLVAESGISSRHDVGRHVAEGADVVLVGEALIRDGDPEAAVRAMTGVTA